MGEGMNDNERVGIRSVEILSDDWAILKKVTFDYRRRDGRTQTMEREVYDRGDGAVILPYDPARGTVLLIRQFRLATFLNGHPQPLVEACAGLLDGDAPDIGIRREAEEELGYRLHDVQHIFTAFTSPGSMTERLVFFVARYAPADRIGAGGGAADEGEDIEVLEMPLAAAWEMVGSGQIVDAKTIMLLQHVKLAGLLNG